MSSNYEMLTTKEFKEGLAAATKHDMDTSKAKNPYKEGSFKWMCWNKGWNEYGFRGEKGS